MRVRAHFSLHGLPYSLSEVFDVELAEGETLQDNVRKQLNARLIEQNIMINGKPAKLDGIFFIEDIAEQKGQ